MLQAVDIGAGPLQRLPQVERGAVGIGADHHAAVDHDVEGRQRLAAERSHLAAHGVGAVHPHHDADVRQRSFGSVGAIEVEEAADAVPAGLDRVPHARYFHVRPAEHAAEELACPRRLRRQHVDPAELTRLRTPVVIGDRPCRAAGLDCETGFCGIAGGHGRRIPGAGQRTRLRAHRPDSACYHGLAMTEADATRFADEWIAAWNSHNLELILGHYSDDATLTLALVARILGPGQVTVCGKPALRDYFQRGLDLYPDLSFTLWGCYPGVDSFVVHYQGVRGLRAAELMRVDAAGRVCEVVAHYASPMGDDE